MSNTRTAGNNSASPPARTPMSAADMISMTKPIHRSVPVCLDGSLRAQYDQAQNATKQMEQALVQAERVVALTKPRKRDRSGFMEGQPVDPDDDVPLSDVGPDEPDDETPIVTPERVKALKRAVAELTVVEEDVRARMINASYEVVVRSYPGGREALDSVLIKHCTGDPLIRFATDEHGNSEPIKANDKGPQGYQFKGFKVRFRQDGEVAREIGDMNAYRAEIIGNAIIDPEMSVEQVREWLTALNSEATADTLVQLVMIATNEAASVPFSRHTTTPE